MVDIESTIDTLAKWAAKQPNALEAGSAVVQLLASAAQIRTEGTPAQKAEFAVRVAGLRFANEDFLTDLQRFNQQTGEQLGWW